MSLPSNGVAVWVSSEALFSTLRNASTTAATETAFIGRTTGGRSRRIGLGRTTFNNDGAVCSAKEGKREGNRAGSPPAYLPPSIPPTRNAAHPEKWSCGQSPERGRRGRAVWLLFSGFVRYSKAAEVIQSTIFRQISMTPSPPRGHATSTVREMRWLLQNDL